MTNLYNPDGTLDKRRNWKSAYPTDIEHALTAKQWDFYNNSDWTIYERTKDDEKVYAVALNGHYIEEPDESFMEAIATIKGLYSELQEDEDIINSRNDELNKATEELFWQNIKGQQWQNS